MLVRVLEHVHKTIKKNTSQFERSTIPSQIMCTVTAYTQLQSRCVGHARFIQDMVSEEKDSILESV